ncbi:hypothetical protein DFH06DRAFT_1009481, partial [Mycena polygramma]
ANLRTEVDRLQKALDAHRLELTKVLEKIDQHSKIISPLRRLPPEILEEIFRRTLSVVSAYDDSPWNISRVCGRWRSISLASPFLWTRVNLSPTIPIDALRAQLERSKPCSLTVYVACQDTTEFQYSVDSLDILLEASRRWQTVLLCTAPKSMILRLNNLNEPGRFPQLRAVVYIRAKGSGTCTAFAKAPQLTAVQLHGSHRRLDVPFG